MSNPKMTKHEIGYQMYKMLSERLVAWEDKCQELRKASEEGAVLPGDKKSRKLADHDDSGDITKGKVIKTTPQMTGKAHAGKVQKASPVMVARMAANKAASKGKTTPFATPDKNLEPAKMDKSRKAIHKATYNVTMAEQDMEKCGYEMPTKKATPQMTGKAHAGKVQKASPKMSAAIPPPHPGMKPMKLPGMTDVKPKPAGDLVGATLPASGPPVKGTPIGAMPKPAEGIQTMAERVASRMKLPGSHLFGRPTAKGNE